MSRLFRLNKQVSTPVLEDPTRVRQSPCTSQSKLRQLTMRIRHGPRRPPVSLPTPPPARSLSHRCRATQPPCPAAPRPAREPKMPLSARGVPLPRRAPPCGPCTRSASPSSSSSPPAAPPATPPVRATSSRRSYPRTPICCRPA